MRGAVRRASGALDRLVPRGNGITVLIYHRVGGGTDSSVDLPTAEFAEQIPAGIYSLPEISTVGLDEAATRELTVV